MQHLTFTHEQTLTRLLHISIIVCFRYSNDYSSNLKLQLEISLINKHPIMLFDNI